MGRLSAYFHFSRFRGINNVDDPIRVYDKDQREAGGHSSLVAATDVEVDPAQMLSQRKGYAITAATGDIHSIWSDDQDICLFVEANTLKRLDTSYAKSDIRYGFGYNPVSYVRVNDKVVVTDGVSIGYVESGIYNEFSSPDRALITGPNFVEVDVRDPAADLSTRWTAPTVKHGKVPPMAGQLVEFSNGRLLIAKGNTLYYSDAYALNQFDLRYNYLQLPGHISMLISVEDGVYVSDNSKVYFIRGANLAENPKLEKMSDYPAIPGSDTKIDGGLIGAEGFAGQAAMWLTNQGVCVGGNGGSFKNLTQKRYRPPTYGLRAASLFRKDKSQFLTSLYS